MSTTEGDLTEEESEALVSEVMESVARDEAERKAEWKHGSKWLGKPRRKGWRTRLENTARQPAVYSKD